jgi:hypothetical protein
MCSPLLHGDCFVLKYITGHNSGSNGRGQKQTLDAQLHIVVTKLSSFITVTHIIVELCLTQVYLLNALYGNA